MHWNEPINRSWLVAYGHIKMMFMKAKGDEDDDDRNLITASL